MESRDLKLNDLKLDKSRSAIDYLLAEISIAKHLNDEFSNLSPVIYPIWEMTRLSSSFISQISDDKYETLSMLSALRFISQYVGRLLKEINEVLEIDTIKEIK